jgi:hypothetical protein
MTTNKCSSNEVYSDLNYDKLREENLKRTEELYKTIFSEYSSLYSDYLITHRDAISNPNNPEAKNKSDAAKVQKKPVIIDLNKKLVDIETEILTNNDLIRKSISEQQTLLEKDNKERNMIDKKINTLSTNVKIAEDKTDTGKYSITDIQSRYSSLTKWYYFFMALVLIFFIIFCILFFITLSSQT